MGVSKSQKHIEVICHCGCEKTFHAFPTYTSKYTRKSPENYTTIQGEQKAMLYVAKYRKGHSPNTRAKQFSDNPWNKGLKKGDHPSIEKMGFQPGHPSYSNFSKINKRFKDDPEFKKRWIESKKGQQSWNKGITGESYPNGIKSGKDHGNWKGGHRGAVDTAAWQKLRLETLNRDNYTCQECGDRNRKGRGSRINLEVHHIIAISQDPTKALDPDNVITLCRSCHYKTHTFGSKGALVKRSGN